MEIDIATYFSQLYHQKDVTNKNKFKFGKMFKENENLIVIIYGKPRGNYFNRNFGSVFNHSLNDCEDNSNISQVIRLNEDTSCGGFRIKWNVTHNTFQYICASKMMPCGCNSGGPISLYISNEHNIDLTEQYLVLKNKLLTQQ